MCDAVSVAGAQTVRRAGRAERLLARQVVESGDELKVEELAGGEWRAMGGGIAKREYHSCTALDGKLWVVGGYGAGMR